MKAIKDTGNNLVAAFDPFDSVGIIDSYFPEADFFTEFERFDRHIDKLQRQGKKIDYVSICSPNYLHDAHIRFALRNKAHAICEKPLVLNPWNVDALKSLEQESDCKIYNILQLRLHPAIVNLKNKIAAEKENPHKYEVDLTYITSRGKWYFYSWKGREDKSGGVATNIGIHFFDMLCWIFGPVKENIVHEKNDHRSKGILWLENAVVNWFLSVDYNDLPDNIKAKDQRTYRSITIQGEEIEFSGGFTDLHTECYKDILAGRGFGLEDARTSIDIAYNIRNGQVGHKE
jgi:UDP-N-acetyl-2-amino-2-deoxyglucuronate dehydrogenase